MLGRKIKKKIIVINEYLVENNSSYYYELKFFNKLSLYVITLGHFCV